ncbi:MAG: glycosyltransferase family 25 protein [Hafnia sp.]|uniref:glycosyltransferase family 25 protein n=1 Tax=Hafnia sp. TaxID=1873498 RepID=UPI002FC6C0DF
MKIPIFVISLVRDSERRKAISIKMNELGVNFTFIDAIDSKSTSNDNLIDSMRHAGGMGDRMSSGEIACKLSHELVYKKIISSESDWAIILEDDVLLNRRIKDLVDGLNDGEFNKLHKENLYLIGGMKGLASYPIIGKSLFNYISVNGIKLRRVTYNENKLSRACGYLMHREMCERFLQFTKANGIYCADDWNHAKENELVENFYYSEIATHPEVSENNSNLESERIEHHGIKRKKRSLTNKILKYIRMRIKTFIFSLRF